MKMQNKNNRNGINHRINAISTENYITRKAQQQQQRRSKLQQQQRQQQQRPNNVVHE